MNSLIHTYKKVSISERTYNYDPTRTITLRNAFISDMNKRFREIRGLIRTSIIDEDCFGLNNKENKLIIQAGKGVTTGMRAFDFPSNEQKLDSFMAWINRQSEKQLLEIKHFEQYGQSINSAWTDKYIFDSYKRGVQRGRLELKKAGYNVPSIEETGGINVSMSTPFHLDRVGVLYLRAFNELKGINDAMGQHISRILAQGLIDGDNPRVLADKLTKTIKGGLGVTDELGRYIPAERRAQTLARTEIIRAHHQATVQEYRNWETEGVKVKAEWSSVGDDGRTCNQCLDLEGSLWTLDEIEKKIPVHPNCRCIALPVKVKDVKKEKKKVIKEQKEFKTKTSDYNNYNKHPDLDKRVSSKRKGQDNVLTGMSNKDLIKLSGDTPVKGMVIDNVDMAFYGDMNGGNVELLMKNNKYFSKVEVSKYKNTILEIAHVDIPASSQGQGIGSKMFLNMIDSAKTNGFKSVELIAAKAEGYNGYYTWARYGFDINPVYEPELLKFKNLVQSSKIENIKNSKTITDLMSTQEGRNFWKKEGFQYHGEFHIEDKYDYFINYFKSRYL